MNESILKEHIDQLFRDAARPTGQLCEDPVVGGLWLAGERISMQKKRARRALLAREWFFLNGPKDAPPLPLSDWEQDDLRYHDPLGHLVTDFARSLQANSWDFNGHPGFDDFARGVLASEYAPDFTRKNAALLKRYPPRPLAGIEPGQVWRPVH